MRNGGEKLGAAPPLTITLAPGFRREQEYILDVMMREFLGLNFAMEAVTGADPIVTISADGKSVCLRQELFSGDDEDGLVGRYKRPSCRRLHISDTGLSGTLFGGPEIPVLYGTPDPNGAWMTTEGDALTLHADVLGSSFFMLTRLEEVGSAARDDHGRFPAQSSLASAHGFLTRPIVDEYTELLWCAMRRQWPGLRRRKRRFAVRTSHDVDRPNAYDHAGIRDRLWLVRHHARSGVLPGLLGSRFLNGVAAALGFAHRDPFDTFDWLMDADEQQGLKATYNFLCGSTSPYDARYDIESRAVRRLLRRISDRGHEIGLHGSYATMDDPARLSKERERLAAVLEKECLSGEVSTGRQHYLRWRAPATWRACEAAGLAVDSSVGFSEAVGFRCGTSFEYPVFDVEARRRLRLRERPLHLMDVTLSDVDEGQSLAAIDDIRQAVARHGGTLQVLWHNNTFAENGRESVRYARAIARDP